MTSSHPDTSSHDVARRTAARQERIHVAIGPVCNNNCIFCMEEDRDLRRVVNGAMSPERVLGLLTEHRGSEEVCFTSGEPTLVRELPRYVSWARRLGYHQISVMTNGRRLAQPATLRTLVAAGLSRFYVSIHGHTAELHDGLVRTPGAFAQTVAGLENLAALTFEERAGGSGGRGPGSAPGLVVHTSTVITRRNLPHIKEIYGFLRGLGVQVVVFNAMQALGRGHTHFERLYPPYSQIVAGLRDLVDAGDELPRAVLVDVPLCASEGLPDPIRGFVERHVKFEPSQVDGRPDDREEMVRRGRATTEDGIVGITEEHLAEVARVKQSDCAMCAHDAVCPGVWRNYVARYGWGELRPVERALTERGQDG